MKSAAWADPDRWLDICDPAGCPICQAGEPHDVIAESVSTWVTAAREAQLPGYVCVVSKHHAVEPFELTEPDGAAFRAEAMSAARILAELTGAVKMNYGIHGNVIPHLHLHLCPRFIDDPYDTGGIPAAGGCIVHAERRRPPPNGRRTSVRLRWTCRLGRAPAQGTFLITRTGDAARSCEVCWAAGLRVGAAGAFRNLRAC